MRVKLYSSGGYVRDLDIGVQELVDPELFNGLYRGKAIEALGYKTFTDRKILLKNGTTLDFPLMIELPDEDKTRLDLIPQDFAKFEGFWLNVETKGLLTAASEAVTDGMLQDPGKTSRKLDYFVKKGKK